MIGPARRARYRAMIFAVFSSAVALAGCGGENDGNINNAASGQDGGVCTRDLVAINDLLAHPVACVNDGQCPLGAYCDPARGACDFQCVTDSACGPGGTCGCDGHCTGGSGTTGGGGSTCERSAGLLQSVSSRTCTADAQCATGMACDAVAHTCEIKTTCTTDAGCPSGSTCWQSASPQYHTCVAKTCAADTDCPSGIACDLTMNKCLVHTPRTCTFDDQCPNGSRCDEATRECRNDCAADNDCAAGTACDCLGKCVAPGTTQDVPGDRVTRLEISPTRAPVMPGKDNAGLATPWAPLRITATLVAPTPDAAMAAKDVDVQVRASAGLLVACGIEHAMPTTIYKPTCTLSSEWTPAPVGSWQTSTQYVWVKPTSALVASGDVTFSSRGLNGAPAVTQLVAPVLAPGEQPAGAIYTFNGDYRGTMTYLGTNWYSIASGVLVPDWDASSVTAPAAFPVRASALQKPTGERIIDFFDATMMLSDTGKLRGSSALATNVDWLAVVDHESGPGVDAIGMYQAKTVLVTNAFDPASGTLRGVLVVVPQQGADPIGFQFELEQVAPPTMCGPGCPVSTTCATSLGICEAGPVWVDGAPSGSVVDLFVAEWTPWWQSSGSGYGAASSIMCNMSGAGSGMSNEVLSISGDFRCANGTVPHGVELVFDSDRAAALGGSAVPTSSGDMLAACLGDLMLRLGSPIYRPSPLSALSDTAAARKCFSPVHFYGAVARAIPSGQVPSMPFAHRLLAQWLTLHGFIAKEAVQNAPMVDAVLPALDRTAGEDEASQSAVPLDAVLGELERGWNFVLSDTRRTALINGTLLDPDYRSASAPTGDQDVALPVFVLETAALHLDTVSAYLRKAQLATYEECRAAGASPGALNAMQTAGRAFRYTSQAESAAVWAYERATMHIPKLTTGQKAALCTSPLAGAPPLVGFPFCALDLTNPIPATPTWQARYDAARAQYEAARQRAVAAAVAVSSCENPLGIEESSLGSKEPANSVPLFFGDLSGNSSRFFASSDYLLSGWAGPAVDHAKVALDAARTSWLEKRTSETQQILTDQEADRRREQIRTGYGQQLVDACGLDGVPASAALARFTGANALRADSCFLKSSAPECARYVNEATSGAPAGGSALIAFAPSPEEACPAAPKDEAIRKKLCMVSDLWSFIGSQDESLHAIAVGFKTVQIHREPSCGGVDTVTLNGVTVSWSSIPHPAAGQVSSARMSQAEQWCRDQQNGEAEEPPYFPDSSSYASCFGGQLGEQVLGTMGSRKNVQLALMDWWDAQKLFDIASDHCDHLKQWQTSAAELEARHSSTMKWLSLARGIASGFVQASTLGDLNKLAKGFATAGTITASGDLANTGLGALFGFATASAEQEYQRKMTLIQNEKELYTCYEEARKVKLRIDNAAAAIEGAIATSDQHLVAFRDLQAKVRNLVADGNAALVREQNRTVPPIAFHYWLDEKIDRFHKDFEWAKSLTYLSMLAVEYEYQQSLGLRGQILSATHPDQLADAIRAMQQTQISRTIDGRRPEDAKLVKSLANDILGLDDLKAARPGERTWTKRERLQRRLWSPEYAVYDEHGVYLGQGVPFSLEPEGELEYACAEKLWTVTATIQGDGLSQLAPTAPLMVLKRNQFASQWCGGHGDGSPLQTASVQPVSQLFHPEDRGGAEAAQQQFVTARISPWFNVPRTDLYREAYAEGASQELAGRGMYGDYILLFPAEGLLRDGFPLAKVEDVLLRFDYLSVDNLHVTAHAADDADDATIHADRAGADE